MAAIAFVGDSFCASYGLDQWKERGCTLNQLGTTEPTFINQVVQANQYDLYPFGFGGKSWWFSRQKFMEELERIPDYIFHDQLEVIVFVHTDPHRINNAWNVVLTNTRSSNASVINYYKNIFDDEFHKWAQQRWFEEIKHRWGHLKTIHFHAFTETPDWSHLLPGVVYTTPLIHISIGELTGNEKEIDKMILEDKRFNHLNAKNNQVLANVILRTIYNYVPGHYKLDLSEFDIVNPNSTHFPHPGYGTEP